MSPRVLGVETGDAGKKHPGREPTDPPVAEFTDVEKSTKAQVAEFRTGRYHVGVPAMVLTALITALSGAFIAWINKPAPPAAVALTPEQAQQLARCSANAQDIGEIKAFVRWAEPQISILLVRTDSRAYTPPPRAP